MKRRKGENVKKESATGAGRSEPFSFLREVAIMDVTHEGLGVGKTPAGVVFCEGVVPGDLVDIEILRRKKNLSYGRAVHFHRHSSHRVTPPCEHFQECGGCTLQHMTYAKQLEVKENRVRQALLRVGKVEEGILHKAMHPIVRSVEEFGYRSRGRFFPIPLPLGDEEHSYSAQSSGDSVLRFGMKKGNTIVPIRRCLLMDDDINATLHALHHVTDLPVPDRFPDTESPDYHRPARLRPLCDSSFSVDEFDEIEIRKYRDSRETLVHFGSRSPKPSLFFDIHEETFRPCDLSSVTYTVGGYSIRISRDGFFQVNAEVAAVLFDRIKQLLTYQQSGKPRVLELYCGAGAISLCVSEAVENLVGIEYSEEAVTYARYNLEAHGFGVGFRFLSGDVEERIRELSPGAFDVILADPPRAGMSRKTVEWIGESGVPRVIYVSCDPGSLARDVAILREYGYEVELVHPFDMFPQTGHVECIALIQRVKS